MSQDWDSQFYDDYISFKSWDDGRPAVLDDVFEHMTVEENVHFLRFTSSLLNAQGLHL
jgi:hypothetical protein